MAVDAHEALEEQLRSLDMSELVVGQPVILVKDELAYAGAITMTDHVVGFREVKDTEDGPIVGNQQIILKPEKSSEAPDRSRVAFYAHPPSDSLARISELALQGARGVIRIT